MSEVSKCESDTCASSEESIFITVRSAPDQDGDAMYSPEDYLPDDDFYYQRKSYIGSHHAPVSRLSSTREANENLQRLHRRVIDLEEVIRNQGVAINEKEAGHRLLRAQLRELKDIKERQVKELSVTVSRLQERNRSLDDEIKRKSEGLDECQKRLILLDKLLATSLPAVEKLVSSLKRFSVTNADLIKIQSKQKINSTLDAHSPLDPDISVSNAAPPNGTSAQFVSENADSGHPSSASDSYNNVIEEASTLQRKTSSEALGDGTMPGLRHVMEGPASPRKQRSHPRVHRNNNRKSNPHFSDSILNELTFSSKGSTPINTAFSPNQSPSYTPPTARREMRQQLPPAHTSSRSLHSYPGSKYPDCQDISRSGISSEPPADHLASEIGTILNFSDGEGSDGDDAVTDDDAVPPPAPPSSSNSCNNRLPSLQVPRRFLPSLRY